MRVLVLGKEEIARLLPMRECIEVMTAALAALARGEAMQPLRQVLRLRAGAMFLALMPAALAAPEALGLKALTIVPDNHAVGLDSHQGVVLLFDPRDGRLISLQDAAALTAVRTAAVSAVATRALARPDASRLALLGAGAQAAAHLEAMRAVRTLREVRVWSRDPERTRLFTESMAERHGIFVQPCATPEAAVAAADLVCTVTAAQQPVLHGRSLAAGAHVNAVGSSTPSARELDAAAVARALLFVDRRESALAEAGDFLRARAEGAVGDAHIRGELGELLLGKVPGRTAPDQITLFKSVGLGLEDVAAAQRLHALAMAEGAGSFIDL